MASAIKARGFCGWFINCTMKLGESDIYCMYEVEYKDQGERQAGIYQLFRAMKGPCVPTCTIIWNKTSGQSSRSMCEDNKSQRPSLWLFSRGALTPCPQHLPLILCNSEQHAVGIYILALMQCHECNMRLKLTAWKQDYVQ